MLAQSTVHHQIVDLTEKPLDERSSLGARAPGETLRMWLDESGVTQTQLARQCGVSIKHVNSLVHGRVLLTPPMALKLEQFTGINARAWCLLESDFRLSLLRGASPCG